ncbi:MAG: Rrf2 family transcriptional regulator [Nitrosomonadales bacterium]|jgi:Rrf2 family protein|nr:MAG: Rrf2 family transcriptional regulator [Nitrosomonadales bacterium]
MIISRTSQYAIQALIYIATQPHGAVMLNRTIAEKLGVSPTYLAKVLQNLCKSNLLCSFRGKQGGFCLQERAEKINLLQIVLVIEGSGLKDECVLGFKVCSDKTPCLMHTQWAPIRKEIVKILQSQSLELLAAEVLSGKYQLSDLPAGALGKRKLHA